MLDTAELRHLTQWCAARRLSWRPACTDAGEPAVLLHRSTRDAAWADMLLVADDSSLTLFDEASALLASASFLPALLDALDAGVAEPTYTAPLSPSRWNRPVSLIT